jgi:hypothetical protein
VGSDAIDLHRQQHWNSEFLEFSRSIECCCTTPALAKQNNAAVGYLFRIEPMIVIGIKSIPDQSDG